MVRRIALTAAALLAILAYIRWAPDRYNITAPIDLTDKPTIVTEWKLQFAGAEKCYRALSQAAIVVERLPDEDKGPGCGFQDVARLDRSLAAWGSDITLTCQMLAGIALWERHTLQPLARELFGSQVVRVRHYGTYSCRNVNGEMYGRRSEHATANAVDIAGFVLADGQEISVLNNWGKTTAEGQFLDRIHSRACNHFNAVLGPDYNDLHRDHFHFDQGEYERPAGKDQLMNRMWNYLMLLSLSATGLIGQASLGPEGEVPRVSIPDTERRVLRSAFVDEEFKLHVYLPRGYPEMGKRYPVIYLLDSEYSFGAVAYAVRRLVKGREIPPAIIVGISYELPYEEFYRRRERDYTPTVAHKDEFPAAGHGPEFYRFMEQELFPFVNRTYATEPEDQALVGLSFSGLFSTWVLFDHPGAFTRFVIISPSLWWDNGVCFRYEEAYAGKHQDLNARVFLTAGERDGRNIMVDVPRMFARLESRKYEGLALSGGLLAGETHRTIFPNAVTKGLRWVFLDRKP